MIKTKTITTDKATLLVVEIDDLQEMIGVEHGCIWYLRRFNNQLVDKTIKLPKGNWQLLGRIPDITEGYVYELIPEVITPIMGFKAYPNFYKDGYCKTSLDSLYSLLQANEVYFDNPLGKLHPTHPAYTGEGITVKEWLEKCKKWQEAQSKVWDKERTFLFIKVD